jgi:hypothetical protein
MRARSVASCLIALVLAVLALAVPADAAGKLVPYFGIECPDATTPGRAAPCYVFVEPPLFQDAPQPTGTITVSVSSLKGTVTPTTCDAARGSCGISYTPKGTGTSWRKDTITVSYSGDSVWYSQRKSAVIAVLPEMPVDMHVYCDPSSVVPGYSTHCLVDVYPGTADVLHPTGTVSFTVPTSKGTVTPSCVLDPVYMSCGFSYTPTGVGSGLRKDTITASYSGDAEYGPATTTFAVAVPKRQPPYLSTYCNRYSATSADPDTCWVEFGPTLDGPTPTGEVTIKVTVGRGTTTPSSCPATVSPCTYTYTPEGAGSATRTDVVTVTYPGDSFWAPASFKAYIDVPAS